MKPLTLSITLSTALLVAACGGQPTQPESKAGVEERTPAAPRAETPAPAIKPAPPVAAVTPTPIAPAGPDARALTDPNNVLSKRSVFFDYDSDVIRDEFRPMLQAHAKYLADNRTAKILVQGNCDDRGSREYNLALGQRRAEAVKRMLVLLGAPEPAIESVSLGEEKPRCDEATEKCWAENRRGDILHSVAKEF